MIRVRVLEIDFLMGAVIVPAGDDGLLCIKLLQILCVTLVPLLTVGKALQAVAGVRGVDGVEVEVFCFEGNEAPFIIHGVRGPDDGKFGSKAVPQRNLSVGPPGYSCNCAKILPI